jgi:hypothetical protein
MAIINTTQTKDNFVFILSNITKDEVTAKISNYFISQSYKLESGTPEDAVYGVGSDLMRMLLGVFSKRYKFQITTLEDEQKNLNVTFKKSMSGISGGVIGYNKLNTEFNRIGEELKTVLA